ncbi:MAG: hypothetical protein HY699_15670 [Deltaproteobacteria bacterium]|nr:hypothetical protein [Deltaproteobacteria bacterium]
MLCLALPLTVASALAEWIDFVPRPLENGGFFDVLGSFERDNIRSGARPAHWTDTFVRERLTLYSIGYSYHPRFIQYQLSLGGTGRQEEYRSSQSDNVGWRQGLGLEYDAKLLVLPEHSYNLELFGRRYEPLFKEQAATQHSSVETSRGALLRYRQKPYFLNASYVADSIESAVASSDVTRVGLNAEYFKRFVSGKELSFNGAFNPSWFSDSQGLEGSSTEFLLGNFVNLQRVRLTSNLTKGAFEHESRAAQRFENDQFAWYELLTAELPWNFRTDASYRYQDHETTIPGFAPAPDRTLSDIARDIQLDVSHRLYQSLDSTYTLLRDARTSSGGETTALSHSLAFNYVKSIPRGRLLAGISLTRGETDNLGQADVVNEPFLAVAVPGAFSLRQQNVAPETIVVLLKSPLAPFETIRLVENVHYSVTPVLNTFEIRMLTLPPQFTVPGTYDFFVSYSLIAGDFGLRSETFGSTTSAELFDALLTPYFSFVAVRSELLSGSFAGTPVDATTYTTGIIFQRGPLRVRGEYQSLEWEVSAYRAWRADVQYAYALNPTTSVYATVAYLNRYYPRGRSQYYSGGFSEETASAAGNIQKQLFARSMFVSVGGSYSRLQGLIDANAYALTAAWIWKIGKLDINVGASAYESDTAGTGTVASRRDHERFYVSLRRRIF